MTRQYLSLALIAAAACSCGDSSKNKVEGGDSGSGASTTCPDGPAVLHYADTDGDGYGNPGDSRELCGAETGWVTNDLDCDDSDNEISPEREEVCDDVDNNCDGLIDDAESATDATNWYNDADGDDFGAGPPLRYGCPGTAGQSSVHGDCDDTNSEVNPDSIEECDGIDNDCNGLIDDGETPDGLEIYEDADDDGWGASDTLIYRCEVSDGWVRQQGDCDDSDATFNPDAIDQCDGFDQDCDGHLDSRCGNSVLEYDGYSVTVDDEAGPGASVARDLNGDDVVDLLVFVPMRNEARFYAGPITTDRFDADAVFTTDDPSTLFGAAIQSEMDFDGDGLADLVVSAPGVGAGSFTTSVRLYTHADDLSLDFNAPEAELTADSSDSYLGIWALPAGDLTGDGNADVVLSNEFGQVFLWDNPTEDTHVTPSEPMGSYPELKIMMYPTIGDIDADGQVDMVVPTGFELQSFTGPLDPEVWMSTPDEIWSGSVGGVLGQGLCSGDLTGDGKNDLAYTETNPAIIDPPVDDRVQLESFEDDTFGPIWSHLEPFAGGAIGLRCADLDGDHQDDLVILGFTETHDASLPVAGRVSVFFGPIRSGTIGEEPDRVILGESAVGMLGLMSSTGDFTGDGTGDLALSTMNRHLQIFDVGEWTSEFWEAGAR